MYSFHSFHPLFCCFILLLFWFNISNGRLVILRSRDRMFENEREMATDFMKFPAITRRTERDHKQLIYHNRMASYTAAWHESRVYNVPQGPGNDFCSSFRNTHQYQISQISNQPQDSKQDHHLPLKIL